MTIMQSIPVLPLRNVVVFPRAVHNLYIGTSSSVNALQLAMTKDKQVLLVARCDPEGESTEPDDLFKVGTLATILQTRQKDGVTEALFEGRTRSQVIDIGLCDLEPNNQKAALPDSPSTKKGKSAKELAPLAVKDQFDTRKQCILADIELIEEIPLAGDDAAQIRQNLMANFRHYARRSRRIDPEFFKQLAAIDAPGRLADMIAAHMSMKLQEKQKALEIADVRERFLYLLHSLELATQALQVDKVVHGRVKKQIDKSQRDYYLNEQMKAIQKELGGGLDDVSGEIADLEKRITSAGLSQEALTKATHELKKLKMMPPMSAEASVVRGYVDWLASVPWKKRSSGRLDLARAERVLNEDHYGLEEVKDRILEYLAVQKRVKKIKGPVLCLVGPPGVGKTSLGESIARAMNLKFVRMALGGVRDESEIRGHRRTYIGSMPGKIIQKLAKVGVRNPLFLLDEVDKMGMDYRGDPAAALLEVLDSEQNNTFNDHYLEVDYDLSQVLFVCTSNSMNIPPPLLDRMEVIRLSGYTEDEKLNIAKHYLLPKQKEISGLHKDELGIPDETLLELIRYYTKEAGVRGLEREIAKVCRKVVKAHPKDDDSASVTLIPEGVEDYNGVRKYRHGRTQAEDRVGHVLGLAWTEVGGELLDIEAVSVPGKGKHKATGRLGDVMQESIDAALTYIRSRSDSLLGLPANFYDSLDVHIHVPEGATPKDGPSAGIAMCTAMISVFTGITVRRDIAMTGEITLSGQLLPVGGLKEKLIAARRGCVKAVIVPAENLRDLKEIPDDIKKDLDIKPVTCMEDVLKIALTRQPDLDADVCEQIVQPLDIGVHQGGHNEETPTTLASSFGEQD